MSCLSRNISNESKVITWSLVFQDFCYYANTIFLIDLLFYPRNEKLFMVCFSFAEVRVFSLVIWFLGKRMIHLSTLWFIQVHLQGPLAWALIVWRCSLVFSSLDKIVSVLIHLLPGKLDPTLKSSSFLSSKKIKIWKIIGFCYDNSIVDFCIQWSNIRCKVYLLFYPEKYVGYMFYAYHVQVSRRIVLCDETFLV